MGYKKGHTGYWKGKKQSRISNLKRVKTLKKMWKNPSWNEEERIAKIKETRQLNNSYKHSVETKNKISLGHKGLKQSKETRLKRSSALKGEKCHLWKGGITKETIALRRTLQYYLWRDAVLERDDYTCQMCGIRGGKLQAHHKKEFAKYPELRFAIQNGITLCIPCHLNKIHKLNIKLIVM
jgi:hypothetical protein